MTNEKLIKNSAIINLIPDGGSFPFSLKNAQKAVKIGAKRIMKRGK